MNASCKKIMFLGLAVAMVITAAYAEKSKVVIKGSTTVLPITQKAAEIFMQKNPNVSISIEGSGSGNGIKAILDSTTDIANSSRAMKDKELAAAKEKGIACKEITVAYDMIVPVVHPSNPVKNLTTEQLKAIYNGTITNWKEVGGADENIVVVSRDSSSGTYEVWHEKVMDKQDVMPKALLQASNGAVLNVVANNKKAIGYIGFGYINETVKPLNVNGIIPTLANGKSGKFAISRKLFMYVNTKNYSKDAKNFVNYILSKEGQAIVKEVGFIPL